MLRGKITKVLDEVNMQQVRPDFQKIQNTPDMYEYLMRKQLTIITLSYVFF